MNVVYLKPMGLFRLLLALSVVIIHANPIFGHQFLASNVAVDSFFIISGFYMAFILNEKYIGKNGSYRLFLTTRLLRIYPLYLVIILLLFGLSLYEFTFIPQSENAIRIMQQVASESTAPWYTGLMMVLRNLTLVLTTDYFQPNYHTPGYLLLLPAWTLQMEVLFYLIAPFVTRLPMPIIALFAVIFGWLTFLVPFPGLWSYPSITSTFLNKVVFFLMGILGYGLYRHLKHAAMAKNHAKKIVVLFFAITVVFGLYSTDANLTSHSDRLFFFYFLLVMLAIPFLFFSTIKNKRDRLFAELSYPVYLSHLVIFKVITHSPVNHLNPSLVTVITIVVTLLFSWLLVVSLEKPIDSMRKNMLK
jgi:peptidoglycan/LPS O-acetylase OafA/YrhL